MDLFSSYRTMKITFIWLQVYYVFVKQAVINKMGSWKNLKEA